jgi:predicted Zn finger-like uncharacterized protein
MIIQCQSCSAKYFLPEEKVPANPLKVRCPKCRAVFMLAKAERVSAVIAPAPPSPAPVEMPGLETAPRHESLRPAPRQFVAPAPPEPAPVAEVSHAAPAAVAEPAPEANEIAPTTIETKQVAPEAEPSPPVPQPAPRSARGGKSADDRAKRLARVLVSDILWYNRERRDAALRDGTLMTSLGEEIKKSWELYKEKVGPEAAHSTNYFKEALNEILANGQQVF